MVGLSEMDSAGSSMCTMWTVINVLMITHWNTERLDEYLLDFSIVYQMSHLRQCCQSHSKKNSFWSISGFAHFKWCIIFSNIFVRNQFQVFFACYEEITQKIVVALVYLRSMSIVGIRSTSCLIFKIPYAYIFSCINLKCFFHTKL